MSTEELFVKLQDKLHSAITQVYHELAQELDEEHEDKDAFSGMLQGYFLLTEWHGLDGSKSVDMKASADARTWEIDGWMRQIDRDIQAQILTDHILELLEGLR